MATKKKAKETPRRDWTPAEDNHLEKLHKQGLRISAIRQSINKRFGRHRKDVGVEGRLDELGLRRKANGAVSTPFKPGRLHRQVVLDLGNEGRITVLLEGKLSQNGTIRQKVNALIGEATGAAKYLSKQ